MPNILLNQPDTGDKFIGREEIPDTCYRCLRISVWGDTEYTTRIDLACIALNNGIQVTPMAKHHIRGWEQG